MLVELYREIESHVRMNRDIAILEERGEVWATYGTGIYHYNGQFEDIIPDFDGDLRQLSENLQQQKMGKVIGMDLMGTGRVLHDLRCGSGLGVSLSYCSWIDQNPPWTRGKIDLLEGDILSASTWREIKHWVDLNGKFDLVLHNPL